MTKQSLNRVLNDLKRMSLLEYKKGEKDTRVKHVYLNEKGAKVYEEIFNFQKKRIHRAFLNSTSKEVLSFDNVLKRIISEKI